MNLTRTIAAGATGVALALSAAVAPAASASPAPHPAVLRLRASVHNVAGAGGRTRITAVVTDARVCHLSAVPALAGIGRLVPCAGGHFAETIRLPALESATPRSFRLTLTAVGHGFRARRSLTVVQGAPFPAIAGFASSAGSVAPAGGTVTLSATTTAATTCTIASTPRLPGTPATFACAGGRVSRTVAIPANTGTATIAYSVTLTAQGRGGIAVSQLPIVSKAKSSSSPPSPSKPPSPPSPSGLVG